MARMLHQALEVTYDPVTICPMCQKPAERPDDRFCDEDGTALARAGQRKVICTCTPTRTLHARYCPSCGTSTDLLVQRAAAEQIAATAHP